MMEDKQHYLFISSSDSKDIFVDNQSYDFRIQLPQTLMLDGEWECALVDFKVYPKKEKMSDIYVFTDIIQESYVCNNNLPLLGITYYLSDKKNESSISLDTILYHKLSRNMIDMVRIYIKDEDLRPYTELGDSVRCTLHLRKIRK